MTLIDFTEMFGPTQEFQTRPAALLVSALLALSILLGVFLAEESRDRMRMHAEIDAFDAGPVTW